MRIVNVIPTYNEKENIEETLLRLDGVAKRVKKHKWMTVVADDFSPDGTSEVVRKHKQIKENLVYLSQAEKAGLGKAMVRGIGYAIKKLKADVVVTNEADLAYAAVDVERLVQKIDDGWDVVVGSRHVIGGKSSGWSWHRRLNHFMANTVFAGWLAGVSEVADHNGALRAVRVKKVQDRLKMESYPVGFGFFNYWLANILEVTTKVVEVPIHYKFRIKGESKVSFNPKYIKVYMRDIREYLLACWKIRKIRCASRGSGRGYSQRESL